MTMFYFFVFFLLTFFENCGKLYLVENVKVFFHLLSGGDNVGSSLVLDLFLLRYFRIFDRIQSKDIVKMTAVPVLTASPNKN